jgi:CyaY protein
MTALTDQEFRLRADEALDHARRSLMALADEYEFEVGLQNGVLNLEFEEPSETKFVVSPNAPTRQIWVAAMTKSYKLAWAQDLGGFALNGEPLVQLLDRLTRTFVGATA